MKSGPKWIEELRDEGWLRGKYHGEGLTVWEIGEILGCNGKTVCYWMKKHGIEARKSRSICNDEKWLREQYLGNLFTIRDIARLAGCSEKTVRSQVKRFGLKRAITPHCPAVIAKGREWLQERYKDAELPIWKIAKELGVGEATIRNYMLAWGIRIRKRGEKTLRMRKEAAKRSRERWKDKRYRERVTRAIRESASRPEIRKAKSERMKALWGEKSIATPEWRKRRSEVMKRNWREGNITLGMIQSPTSIEIKVAEVLDKLGIPHESQYIPAGTSFIYDEFIPPKTLIEIHGDYWHSEEYNPQNVKRDRTKKAWALENRYQHIIIWEHEMKEIDIVQLIRKKLAPSGS